MDAAFYEDLDTLARRFVVAGSGLAGNRVLQGNSKGRTPKSDAFATVLLIDDREVGLPTDRPTSPWVTSTPRDTIQHRQADYSVQFFRAGSHARAFSTWLTTETARLEEERLGLRIGRQLVVRQMDAVVDGAWEPRVVLQLPVGYSSRMNEDIGRIEVVDWTVRTVRQTVRGTVNAT